MKVRARINNYRSSASKARLIASVIKGLGAIEAQIQLGQLRKGCADDVRKLVASAVANAENNHGLNKESLVVSEYIVEEGRTMKRWRPRAHGRAAQILKRTCNIIVGLEERKEGEAKRAEKKLNDQPAKEKEKEVAKEEKHAGRKKEEQAGEKPEKESANS